MSAYQLGQVSRKQVAGKDIIEANVKGDEGIVKVTIWKTDKDGKVFPNFDNLNTGDVVEGNLWQKPGTTNWTLYPPKEKKSFAGNGMGAGLVKAKTEAITQAQDRKDQSITKAQERNEVMYAKKSAAEIIAHHPAFKDLNDLNISHAFQNLTRTIYNFNPATSLTAMEVDNVMSKGKNVVEDINPDEIDF